MLDLETRRDVLARMGIDAGGVAAHLAGAIQLRTVSARDGTSDTIVFARLHDYLARTYPRVHERLSRETFGDSLLYEWRGADAAKPPIVLMGHLDVVPVDSGSETSWSHPPYSGIVDKGLLYGRGSLDDKSAIIAILDAVEKLIGDGHAPARTILLAFGGDEEVGGEGAHQIVERIRSRHGEPAMVLDEGGAVMEGQLPGVPGLAAMIGIAEKGYLSLEVSARGPGGHSSTPTPRTSIGRVCRALARLEAHQFPPHLDGATLAMLRALVPLQSYGYRLALTNLWALRPLVIRQFLSDPKMATLVRTTTAPTIFHAGDKENVLPKEAKAIVNFQILTGETTRSVLERVKAVIADPGVEVQPVPGGGIQSEPSPVSDITGAAFAAIAKSIRQTLGGATPPVVIPFLTGPTDSRYWSATGTKNVFRFTPFPYETDWMSRAHGTDERISVQGLANGVAFYLLLIRNAAEV